MTWGSQFSPSTTWIPSIELRSSGLAVSALTQGAISILQQQNSFVQYYYHSNWEDEETPELYSATRLDLTCEGETRTGPEEGAQDYKRLTVKLSNFYTN